VRFKVEYPTREPIPALDRSRTLGATLALHRPIRAVEGSVFLDARVTPLNQRAVAGVALQNDLFRAELAFADAKPTLSLGLRRDSPLNVEPKL